jgi:hypothetical protein
VARDHPLLAPSAIEPVGAPDPLRLLDVPHVFTQTGLLDVEEFRTAARERGLRLKHAKLELLHRRRLLVPLMRIHSRTVEGLTPIRPIESS